ncbi:hypothetical protein RHGRI_022722 [Rhododendron griersonianum]|uniref:Uncharacterized protein n=1 Tax=Rhododendron griersonianum TaxID=479676 RepID=A0AAV6J131_9ERIC|nr:hypothetical protein RHGRI_022722 [Rhododendron griersonianum]
MISRFYGFAAHGIETGYAQPCSLSSVIVDVAKTGRVAKGRPEFQVVVNNTCICTQTDLVLSCDGFTSYEPLKPEVLKKVDGGCLVNDGGPVFGRRVGGSIKMMALRVFFVFLLVLFLSGQGYAQCDLSSVTVEVAETGRQVAKGNPVFEVVVNNTCICTQSHLVLSCDGFTSDAPLKPEVLRKVDGGCLVKDGQPVFRDEPFNFSYVGTLPTKKFTPVSSQISCS